MPVGPEKLTVSHNKSASSDSEKYIIQWTRPIYGNNGKNFHSYSPNRRLQKANKPCIEQKFELFYRNICNLGILSNKDLDFVKTRKEAALSSYQNYNNNVPQHLSKEEFLALQNQRKNKNIVIQKFDKGNSVVVVDEADYLDKMDNLLNDTRKF